MRRKLVLAAMVLVTFLLQTTVFSNWTVASVAPNLLLILTVSFGFLRGKKGGAFSRLFLRSCHRSVLRRYSGAQCPYLYVSGLSERVCSQNLL